MHRALGQVSYRLHRRLAFAVLCTALSASVFATQKLTLCFENKLVLPWRTVEQSGLNFELLKRVESKLQLSFDYELLPWKRCLAKLKDNQVDGAFTVSYSEERRKFGAFPGNTNVDAKRRMHYARYFLVRRKGSDIGWDGEKFNNVHGKIAFQLGYSVGEMLRAQKVAVDETNDSAYNVGRKVLAGRVAGAAMMDSDVSVLMRSPLASGLEVVDVPLTEKPYYLILSNALVKAKPELAERIWRGIEEVRDGKEYGKLVKAAGADNAR
jgi:polar amino acid transport system substrate-binding protein